MTEMKVDRLGPLAHAKGLESSQEPAMRELTLPAALTQQTSIQAILERPVWGALERAREILGRGDEELAEKILAHLQSLPLSDLADPDMRAGVLFTELWLDPLELAPSMAQGEQVVDAEVGKLVELMRHQGLSANQIAIELLEPSSAIYAYRPILSV